MLELVINACYGGFGLSEEACKMIGLDNRFDEIDRDDYRLVKAVHTLGKKANGFCADLKIVEIPLEATDYFINEYDGAESVIYVVDGKLHFAG